MEKIYNKLVRDKIPEIITENGAVPYVRVLDDNEYKEALEKKLLEEYREVIEATGNDRIEELADMLEVMCSLTYLEGKDLNDIILAMERKKNERGGFTKKLFLEKVNEKTLMILF